MNAAKPERIAISPPMNFTSSLYCTAAAVAAPKKDVVVRALAVVSVSFILLYGKFFRRSQNRSERFVKNDIPKFRII